MPGVKISDRAIFAAKSIVIKDVPAYTIVEGNPAKIIRQRFSGSRVRALLEISWRNWDIEKITRNLTKSIDADIEALKKCV